MPSPANPIRVTDAEEVLFVAYGDSYTRAWEPGPGDQLEQSWATGTSLEVQSLSDRLGAHRSGLTSFNAAISGARMLDLPRQADAGPPGADAVVIVEDTELDGAKVKVYKPVYPRQNASPLGEDIKQGSRVLAPGTLLDPSKIGVLAALGYQKAAVYQKPQVAVIPSGNEIVVPGDPLSPGKIYDINSYTLSALITENGGLPRIFPVMKDTLESVTSTIREALSFDLILISGGSSVGERDMMVEAVERMGEVKFHGIAVKPGKPTLCGIVEGHLVLGIPGYPTSCLTNGYGMLAPALRKMARLRTRSLAAVKAPMARRYTSTIGRHQYLPVRLEGGEVHPVFKESGAITSMADAEGYIEIPANVDLVEKGEVVEVLLF
jgi:molybdenum cofactor synthesis domain-containing protein